MAFINSCTKLDFSNSYIKNKIILLVASKGEVDQVNDTYIDTLLKQIQNAIETKQNLTNHKNDIANILAEYRETLFKNRNKEQAKEKPSETKIANIQKKIDTLKRIIDKLNTSDSRESNSGADVNTEEKDTSEATSPGSKTVEKLKDNVDDILEDYFLTTYSPRLYRQAMFARDVFDMLVVDRVNKKLIKNEDDLNNAIIRKKNYWYSILKAYLGDIGASEEMFDENGNLNVDYELTLNEFEKRLPKQKIETDTSSQDLQAKIRNGWAAKLKNIENEDSKFFDALNAFINLKYFDILLQDAAGEKVIVINSDLKNIEADRSFMKYTFGNRMNELRRGWNTGENIDGLKETSNFVKMIISNIPFIDYKGTKTEKSFTLNPTMFSSAFTNLFIAANKAISKGMEFGLDRTVQFINTFHANPNAATRKFLRELFEINNGGIEGIKNALLDNGLSDFDLNVLYSVYKFLYAGEDSISNIEYTTFYNEETGFLNSFIPGDFSPLECVVGFIDRIMPANYLGTYTSTDGETKIIIKKKFSTRNREMNLRNQINQSIFNISQEASFNLTQKYSPERDVYGNWTVNINGLQLYFSTQSDSNTIFAANDSNTSLKKIILNENGNNTLETISQLFTQENILALNNATLTPDQEIVRDVLQFIQDTLGLNLKTDKGIEKLITAMHLDKNVLFKMLKSAVRYSIVAKTKYDAFNSDFDTYYKYVTSTYPELSSGELKRGKIWSYSFDENNPDILAVRYTDEWVDTFTSAEAILDGSSSRSNTKDIFGNSIGNFSISFMGGNLPYYIWKSINEIDGVDTKPRAHSVQGKLLFAHNQNLLQGNVINLEAAAKDNTKKSVKKMNTSELLHQSIFSHFYGSFLSEGDLQGNYIIQPTTYSDKTKIIKYIINAKLALGSISPDISKSLSDLSIPELIKVYTDTVGAFYQQAFTNTINKYLKMFGYMNFQGEYTADFLAQYPNPTNTQLLQVVVNKLEEINNDEDITNKEDYLTTLAQTHRVTISKDFDYRNVNGKVKFNELLDYYANYLYTDQTHLKDRLKEESVKFLNEIIASNLIFYTEYLDGSQTIVGSTIEQLFPSKSYDGTKSNPLWNSLNLQEDDNIRDKYLAKWVKNGRLILARKGDKEYIFGETIPNDVEINPILENYIVTDSLLSNNLRLSLTGSELQHPAKGAPVVELNSGRFDDTEKYFKDNKSKFEKIESITQLAQLKRNVIIPATLQYCSQGTLRGIPRKNHMAIIYDAKADVFNYNGENKQIDGNDGSGTCNSLINILENNSLQDQKIGDVKKTIMHAPIYDTGGVLLGKWAIFGMENENMRSSRESKIDYYKLNKAMLNQAWYLEGGMLNSEFIDLDRMRKESGEIRSIDLTEVRGQADMRDLDFSRDILKGKHLYYQKLNRQTGQYDVYEITDFKKDKTTGVYYTVEYKMLKTLKGEYILGERSLEQTKVYHLFDSNSEHLALSEEEFKALNLKQTSTSFYNNGTHTINSNFELVESLGGIKSVEWGESDTFEWSNSSNYAAVEFINALAYINDKPSKKDTRQLNSDMYYQPLKDCMIHYTVNSSAIKNGAGNINQKEAWEHPGKLKYITIDYDGIGVQQDSDHEADEALLTEFSQVLSSLDALGNLHHYAKQVYQDLQKIAKQSSITELDAVRVFINRNFIQNNPKELVVSQLYDIVARVIINNFKTNNEANLANEIINAVKKVLNSNVDHLKDEFKIPFSDPGVYKTLLPQFVSEINAKSIKRKYPGSGMVQCPSFGFKQLYHIDGIPYQFKDIIAKLQREKLTKAQYKIQPGETENQWEARIVREYLNQKQAELEAKSREEGNTKRDQFHPTEHAKIAIKRKDTGITEYFYLDLSSMQNFVMFTEDYWYKLLKLEDESLYDLENAEFFQDITKARELAPAKTTWEEKVGDTWVKNNAFLTTEVRKGFTDTITYTVNGEARSLNVPKSKNNENRAIEIISRLRGEIPDTDSVVVTKNKSKNSEIQAIFRNLKNGYIIKDGQRREIRNLQDKASEVIMSSLNKSKYLDHTDLPKIKEHPELLKIEPKFDIDGSENYHITLSKHKGRPAFITFNSSQKLANAQEQKFKYVKPKDEVDTKLGKVTVLYNIDKHSNEQFPIGYYELQFNLKYNDKGKIVNEAGEEIDTSKEKYKKGKNGEVFKLILFVKKYEITKLVTSSRGDYPVKSSVYQIDYNKILKVLNLNALNKIIGSIYELEGAEDLRVNFSTQFWKTSEVSKSNVANLINNFDTKDNMVINYRGNIASLLRDSEKSFEDTNGTLDAIRKFLREHNKDGALEQKDINKIKLDLRRLYNEGIYLPYSVVERFFTSRHKTKEAREKDLLEFTVQKYIDNLFTERQNGELNNLYNTRSNAVYTSFLKSLQVICSRIPAQSLQSFLQGEVVGFLQTSKNYVYVSPWQLYLQGSDYRLYFVDITLTLIKIVVI